MGNVILVTAPGLRHNRGESCFGDRFLTEIYHVILLLSKTRKPDFHALVQWAHLRLERGETLHGVTLVPAVEMSVLMKVEGLCGLTLGDEQSVKL